MSYNFSTYLTSNLHLDEHALDSISENCNSRSFKKGDYLLQEGQTCTHTFFVEKGLLKQYSIDNKGKEHILYFAPESWFLTDRASMFFNEPSHYFIQALEDSVVRLLDESLMEKIAKTIPDFVSFNQKLLHNHINQLQKRVTSLQSATAEERYLDFIRVYPDITLRVPQALIASYLGITPESLSRVRKELAQRHH